MSTTFCIVIPNEYADDFIHDHFDEEYGFIDEVAFRNNKGRITWLNSLAPLLSDSTPVVPIDNEAQGIHTIGDIKKERNIYAEKMNKNG